MGDVPVSLAAADFNLDGNLDLAVANKRATVALLLNTCGTGVNTPPGIIPAAISQQQGSAGKVFALATVSDTETPAENLQVELVSVPAGITMTGLTNINGTITATITAGCAASTGANQVMLKVTDAGNVSTTATLTVNVAASTPPTLGSYPPAGTINVGEGKTITPTAIPSDNGTITSLTVTTLVPNGGFTGALTVNPATGVVTISNASPAGTYEIAITATDNCGATTTRTFSLTVNALPVITAATIPLSQGSMATATTIATVSDAETPAQDLIVAAVSVPLGITLTGLANSNGRIIANIATSCDLPVGDKTLVLKVTDAANAAATANLILNISVNPPPTGGDYPAVVRAEYGENTTATPNPLFHDNGTIASATATTAGFAGRLSVNPATGVVTITDAKPEGNYTVQVAATDNCGATLTRSFTLNVGMKPDLQVDALAAPGEVFADTAFEVTWTDKNEGSGNAEGPWTDRIYLSTDNQIGNDTSLAGFIFSQSLVPGHSAQRVNAVSIPRSAIPTDGQYFLLVFADADGQVKEKNEGNNWRAIPITVRQKPLPDLVVTTIGAPDAAFFDQTITVRWTVKNIGQSSTNAAEWTDWVYLSSDNIPEIEDPVGIPVKNFSYLDAGESYIASADIRIPRGLIGAYNVIVYTDFDGTNHINFRINVAEENEANNYDKLKAINLSAPPVPDLQVTTVQSPEEAFTGQPVSINWRVENRGSGNTPQDQAAWFDGIYLSQTTSFNPATARLIGSRKREGGLTKDDGYTVSGYSVTLPNDIVGDWYVFVIADYQNGVYEFTGENNNSNYDQRRPLRIRATPPDLVVTSITAPATGAAASQITVNWKVKNQGAFDASPNWFDTVYLSNSATLDPKTAQAIATFYHSSNLEAGLSYNASATVTLPNCIAGDYYLFVYTDSQGQVFEYDPSVDAEKNNFSAGKAIQIASNPPDLQVASVTNPATGTAGQTVSVNWTVANRGTGDTAPTSWIDRVYLSPTATFDWNTALLAGSFTHDGALAPNATYAMTQSISIPTTVAGNYFVFVQTDAANAVGECAVENNNQSVSPTGLNVTNIAPDLTVASLTTEPSAFPGQTITVRWTGSNAGTVSARATTWNDGVWFSTDQTLDGSDKRLAASLIFGPLSPSLTYQAQAQVTIPNVAAGAYYLIVNADDQNYVFEAQREDNNTRHQAIQIQIPEVDLQVTSVDTPTEFFSGLEMPVSWTVTNRGMAQSFATQWTDNVILSPDQVLDLTDQVIGFAIHNGALAGNASYAANRNVAIPSGLTGPHYIFIRTDVHNVLAEANETNNFSIASKPIFLQLLKPVDLIVTAINLPVSGAPGEPATISWTGKNSGLNDALGRWTDAIYLSKDQMWDSGDVVIGRRDQTGPLPVGQSYTGTFTMALPAVDPGNYYVIVRTDVRNKLREDNETNNATASGSSMKVDVLELTLGVPHNSTIQTGEERYYKVNVQGNETLRFTLDGQNPRTSTELFARFGMMPSRSVYDYLFNRPDESDQVVVVPNTQAGTYYSLARGAIVPTGTDAFSIKAEVVPFSISSVSPNRIGDKGQVTVTIKGAKFQEGAAVKVVNNGTLVAAADVTKVDEATLKASFLLNRTPHGIYDVAVMNPDGSIATLAKGLTIEGSQSPQIQVDVIGMKVIRGGRQQTYQVVYANRGNVDAQFTTIWVAFPSYVAWKSNDDQVLTMTTQTNEGDTLLSVNIPTIPPYGIGTFSFFLTPPDDPPFGHRVFSLRVIADPFTPFNLNNVRGKTAKRFTRIRENTSLQPSNPTSEFSSGWPPWCYEHGPMTFTAGRGTSLTLCETLTLVDANNSQDWSEFLPFGLGLEPYAGRHFLRTSIPGDYQETDQEAFLSGCDHYWSQLENADDAFARGDIATGMYALGAAMHTLQDFFSHTNFVDLAGPGLQQQYLQYLSSRGQEEPPRGLKIMGWDTTKTLGGNPKGDLYPHDKNALDCSSSGRAELARQAAINETRKLINAYSRHFENRPCVIDGVEIRLPIEIVTSSDPNDKLGPIGYGPQQFVGHQKPFLYQIDFENVPTATAAALRVRITDQLDSSLDPRTFRLREIGFGKYRITVPENRAFYQGRIQLGEDLGNQLADISAGVDIATGQVSWTLTAIDPQTGEQPLGALLGLLLPNDETGRGQGFVTYTILPKSGVTTGTQITNKATITFDTEEPITTNAVTNTLDADLPMSAVEALPASSPTTFTLRWTGADVENGSGLQSFDIWVAENDGPYQPFLTGTTETSAQFTGQFGKTYRFYSIARDNAGNVEESPSAPDALTVVELGNQPPTITTVAATRQQGTAAMVAAIATVGDQETPAGNLVVTLSPLPQGITLTGLTNANGAITAMIGAGCNATVGTTTVGLTVTDSGGLTATANLTVMVTANTPPTLGTYPNTTINVGSGTSVTPTAAPGDNGMIISVAATAAGVESLSVDAATGVVSLPATVPVGNYTVVVTATDNCNTTTSTRFTLAVLELPTCGNYTFSDPLYFATAANPASVATGDFDGDGKTDMVTANYEANNVSVLLNDGAGSFKPAVNFAAGTNPKYVAVGDFNGDQKLDLAVANYVSGDLSILLGDGKGNFSLPGLVPGMNYPTSIAIGDFNGDQKADLAVTNSGSYLTTIIYGNGDGTFGNSLQLYQGSYPVAVVAGDFNKDGRDDLAVANNVSNTVTVFWNSGEGVFTPISFAVGEGPISVVAGDVNGDGYQDLAVANYYANDVSVLVNDLVGGFRPPINFPTGMYPLALIAADLNGDGRQDLVVANQGSGFVSLLVARKEVGTTTFTSSNIPVVENLYALAVGDFNGDGKGDVALADYWANRILTLRGACVNPTIDATNK